MALDFGQLDYKNRLILSRVLRVGDVYSITVDENGVIELTPVKEEE